MRWLSLIFWLGLCFTAAGIGGRWTTVEIPSWYRTLARPAFAPPDWVFGPVWSLLYALMAIAAWQVWQSAPSQLRAWGLALFVAQLALNLAWSWIFFRQHAIGAAAVEVVLMWAVIGVTVAVFSRVAPLAAWLMAPYLAWVSFAAVLNVAFWRLN
ncbi:MAG: TspO/MBR family protein [Terracidiphilus sp.]|jgi:tryptophan-rich sensory protein